VKNDTLPVYSFIEPRHVIPPWNSQHPFWGVSHGALRSLPSGAPPRRDTGGDRGVLRDSGRRVTRAIDTRAAPPRFRATR
jgi:hypothetical protein